MRTQQAIVMAIFFAIVPVTLPVAGLHELIVRRGGTDGDAHLFMTINMVAGMLTVPVVMRLQRRWPDIRQWIVALLAVDALAFVGMGLSPSTSTLLAFRTLDGAMHLPALTLLMVSCHRKCGTRRGAAVGAMAAAIMIGVAIGSPLGGWVVDHHSLWLFPVGATLLVVAAGVTAVSDRIPGEEAASPRTRWTLTRSAQWVPLAYGFMDRFAIGVFVSTFTLFLRETHALSASARGGLIALFMLPFAALCYPVGKFAERRGWLHPLLIGNVMFGLVFGAYGVTPTALLPLAMVASGVFSALMYASNLLLISRLAAQHGREGIFGAFQISGALGFLFGPMVGGVLVHVTRQMQGTPAYTMIFALVGALEITLAAASWPALHRLARRDERRFDEFFALPARELGGSLMQPRMG